MNDRSNDNWDAYQYDGSRQLSGQTRRDVQRQPDNYQYDGGGDPYADYRGGRMPRQRDCQDSRFVDQQRFVDDSGRTVIINNYITARNVYLNQDGGHRGGYDPRQNPGYYDRDCNNQYDRYRTSYYPDRQQQWRDPYDDPYRQQIMARQEAMRAYQEACRRYGYGDGYDPSYSRPYYRDNGYYAGNYYGPGSSDYSISASPGRIAIRDYQGGNGYYGRVPIPDCYGSGNASGYYDQYGNQGINQFFNILGGATRIAGNIAAIDIALRHNNNNRGYYRGY